jgi:ACS family tartrate transporter-like MFS transporter
MPKLSEDEVSSAKSDVERRTMRKIFWRLMPIIMLGSAFNNVDRSNIGFAAIKMNTELGLTAAQFGFAAGIFYLSYVVFCIPGNMIGLRVGLRKWLPAIMVAWGLCSMATALATNAAELGLIRLLLGATEAGFVPGAMFLISLWVPDSYRGRYVACFWVSASVAAVIASPLSAYILTFDELGGLRSWQMLFVAEAAPVCLIGLVGFWLLHDNPTKAKWLSSEELGWLMEQQGRDPRMEIQTQTGLPDLRAFGNARVALLSVAFFLYMTTAISFSFFFPSYLSSRGINIVSIGGVLTGVHFMGIVGHLAWGRWSDYMPHNRQLVCLAATLIVAVALCLLPLVSGLVMVMVLGCATQMGLAGTMTSFWPMPMAAVRASAAAGVLAGIAMLGNLTGLIGPYFTGLLRDRTTSYALSFTLLAISSALAGGLILASRLRGSDSADRGRLVPRVIH